MAPAITSKPYAYSSVALAGPPPRGATAIWCRGHHRQRPHGADVGGGGRHHIGLGRQPTPRFDPNLRVSAPEWGLFGCPLMCARLPRTYAEPDASVGEPRLRP